MDVMAKVFNPTVGMRFELHGARFEVSFVAHGSVRYAATAGGHVHQINFDRFIDLQKSGKITSTDGTSTGLSEYGGPGVMRKHRYVEAALRTLIRPTARGPLAEIIGLVAKEISDPAPPSTRTVAYWICNFRKAGFNGLIPQPPSGNSTERFGVEIEQLVGDAIREQYLTRERRGGDVVHCQVVGKAVGLELLGTSHCMRIPTIRTIQRRLRKLDPYIVAKAQNGALAANKLARAAGRSLSVERILMLVQMDTHLLDLIVIDPKTGKRRGRPYLTCIQDINSRAIIGIYISFLPPSATTALAALKDMLTRPGKGLPGGICVMIIPDNGVEFANSAFIQVCEALAITISPAQSRDPNGKAHIESFFRTLTYGLIQLLEGTTFSNPQKKGDYDSSKNACYTLENVTLYIHTWVNTVYHQKPHSQSGRAPILAWEEQAAVMMPASLSDADANVLARRPYHRTIQRGRVQFQHLFFYSHALATLEAQGKTAVRILVDELNFHYIFVEHPEKRGTYIQADSTEPAYTLDLTFYEHQKCIEMKKQMSNADREKLGPNANIEARWRLLEQIKADQLSKTEPRRLKASGTRKRPKDKPLEADEIPDKDTPPCGPFPPKYTAKRPGDRDQGTWENPIPLDAFDLE
ncbi:transposase [Janthinobacterium sp. PSPC1-1]|uniref:transposase n=1 Tax=Janthinobacterium sp. PSPC1-1 TaxID=2804581 RepID=UPI003CF53FAA